MLSLLKRGILNFQSTLLQEERPQKLDPATRKLLLSIHAPTRGATLYRLKIVMNLMLSIHAPTRGATC